MSVVNDLGRFSEVLTIVAVVGYALGMYVLARRTSSNHQGNSSYHLADRKVGGVIGALSVASTWVWAPALLVSATQGFNNGWVGVAWFVVPNALALVLMLPLALKIREKYPQGFTLSGLMRRVYGRGTQALYGGTLGGLAMLSVSVNLLAGGTVLSMLTGLPLAATAGGMLVLVLLYTYRYGVKASFATDVVQILLILGILALLVPSTLTVTGWDVLAAGMHGVNEISGLFSEGGLTVAVTFGITSAIGLAAGPVGDQAFWQRAYAMKPGQVVRAFGGGAVIFTLVPVLMCFLGFAAAGSGFNPDDPGYVNLELVQSLFPLWISVPFMLLLVSALFSVVNSHLLAQASLVSDYTGRVKVQRAIMLALGAVSLGIALVPGNSVTTMFLIYSTLRSSTFLITLTTLSGARWNPRGVFWGILSGLAVGMPLAVYGNLLGGGWVAQMIAVSSTTLLPLLVASLSTLRKFEEVAPDYRTAAELSR